MIDLIAQIAGYLAMATIFLSFQIKNPKGTVVVMGIATALFSLHFGLIGAVVGCTLNLLNVLRTIIIITTDRHKPFGKILMHSYSWLYALAPFIFAMIPGIEVGLPDYVLGLVMVVQSYVLWIQKEHHIRIALFFLISPGWVWYNFMNGSIPGMITESLNMGSIAIYYFRQWFFGKKKSTK